MINVELNWVKSNLDKRGNYHEPFWWAGEDMYINLFQDNTNLRNVRSNKRSKNTNVKGNLLLAHRGNLKNKKMVGIDPNFKIVGIKYFENGYIHYKNVNEYKRNLSPTYGTGNGDMNSTFRINNGRRILFDFCKNEVKLAEICLDVDVDNGWFSLNVFDEKYSDIIICGIKLDMMIGEDGENFYDLTAMQNGWHNYSIIKHSEKFCPKDCEETLMLELLTTNYDLNTFEEHVKQITIKFEDPKLTIINEIDGYIKYNQYIQNIEIEFAKGSNDIPGVIRIFVTGNHLNLIQNITIGMKIS